jgi:hypothetical protein
MQHRRRTSTEAFQLPSGLRLPGILLTAAVLSACEHSVVSVVEVSEIEISPARMTLIEGESETVSVILRENGGAALSDRAVTWTVEDEEVASVDSDGVVEARGPGMTRIHASSGGVSGTAEVIVVPDPDGSCNISDRTFDDDLEIARNQTCTFTNVRVRGDVKLRRGAVLIASELRVDGDIEGDEADEVRLTRSRIGGDVEFEKGGASPSSRPM